MHFFVSKKLAFLLLLLILICSLGSCTNDLVYQFDHSGSEEKDVKDAIQILNYESKDDNVTVQVIQSLGDLNLIYVTLNVAFDDRISLEELVLPQVLLTSNKVDMDEVDSMDWSAIQYWYGVYGGLRPGRTEVVTVDATKNSISYLLRFGIAEWSSYNDELTLFVGDFMNSNKKIVADGIHVFSWVPEISQMALESSIDIKDDLLQGKIRITPFAMYSEFSASPYESFDDLMSDIKIILLDGTEYKQFKSSSGGFTPSSGTGNFFVTFSEILDLNRVSSVKIGDISVVN